MAYLKTSLFFCGLAAHAGIVFAAEPVPPGVPATTGAAPTHVHQPGMVMPEVTHMDHVDHADHMGHMGHMPALLGPYSMTREASGTSWQPESAAHEGIHGAVGEWNTMVHGFANLVHDRQTGPRGATQTFSQSMLMLMGQRSLGSGTLGLRGMFSLDPLMGKNGYSELFQTGETANGITPLIDRQHPHDLIMEMAATWSVPLSADSAIYVYAGLPGEPALGPTAYMHRFSGAENPEAPITHHWLDSTHISFGVTTLGYVLRDWKFEASAFHGREPDQFRYNIETGPLDSHSVRLTWNPTPDWSAQISRGRLHSPEALTPDIDIDRTTASVTNNLAMGGNVLQSTLAWGRNRPAQGRASNGYLLESAYAIGQRHTVFGRLERVDKNELFLENDPLHDRSFGIGKASIGYVYDFPTNGHVKVGIGGMLSGFTMPSELKSVYGENPTAALVFLRLKLM